MNFLVEIILPYVLLYKYFAIFVVTFLSAFILPIPAGTILVVSATFANQNYFNIYTLVVVAIIANILGDSCSYFLARAYAKKFFLNINFSRKILISKNFLLIEKIVRKHPGLLIIVSRFEVLSTLTTNLICGISHVKYKKFLFFEIIGTFLSVIFYVSLGYIFSASWQAVSRIIGDFTILFFLIVIIGTSVFWKRVIKKLDKID